jgi:hypothetical protein
MYSTICIHFDNLHNDDVPFFSLDVYITAETEQGTWNLSVCVDEYRENWKKF